jgi:hypothetical protein
MEVKEVGSKEVGLREVEAREVQEVEDDPGYFCM